MPEKTLILESGNCSWNKCVFCGYSRSAARRPHAARLKVGLDRQLLDFQGGTLKIFASGSFLDDAQFPREFRQYLAQKCRAKGVDKLIFESRPEFITEESLKDFEGISLSVAIGLEVADDEALSRICKGFKVEDFVRAAKLLHTHGFGVRAYLLVNPPFAGDIEKSLKKSVELALPLSDSIVLINLLPHGSAPLFKIWLRGEWKPLSRKRFFEITGPYANSPKIELDAETFRFVPRFPDSMRESLVGVSSGMLNHPHFNAWQQYICDWHERPEGKRIALFLPCSARKPYAESKTHTLIYNALKSLPKFREVHRIVVSSPGVIPFEFNNHYPFNAYDWDERLETPEIKREYTEVTKKRIMGYLRTHKYEKYFCFFKPGAESYAALQQACEEMGIGCPNCLSKETYEALVKEGKNPLQSEEALAGLRAALTSA